MTNTEAERRAAGEAALATLEPFAGRLLPGMLRRLLAWRGCADACRGELLLDLRQELRLDCLQHPELIVALRPRDRHQRWFRLVERWVYRQRLRPESVAEDFEPAARPPGTEFEPSPEQLRRLLPSTPRHVLAGLSTRVLHYGNGRGNVTGTANRVGVGPRHL